MSTISESAKDKATESANVYNALLKEVKSFSGKTEQAELAKTISILVEGIIEALSSENVVIALMLYTSRDAEKEDYIFTHSLNVCLVSVMIGLKKNLDKRQLKDLAILALAHAEEHIGIPEDLLGWVERTPEMDEILKIADVYDAMTHPPSYRHDLTPFETLTSILDACDLFEPPMVKTLLEELGFYPEGSWVELNTREVGKVVEVNNKMPLRPVVEIVIGEKKTMDLSRHMLIYIVRGLTEEEVKRIKKEGRFD